MKKIIIPVMAALLSACGAKASNQDAAQSTQAEVEVVTEERVPAPDFTLNNMDGKPISLSEFRGHWVILDFWGSWCPWCIKGFPALKEAYKEYAGKVEVIGIDCGDTPNTWKEAVRQHNLPWVQVYCPQESNVPGLYQIQGFPTKFIIDPEGNIANQTIGEDPAFFDVLRGLVK